MAWTTSLNTMLRQKALLPSICLLTFIANLTLALPPGAPWTNFASKSVYSRALGPPGGMNTISVPYVPKPSFMPKFVDPKTFISKKTDMLSNLFGGPGPVAYNVADTKPIIPYGLSGVSSASNADTMNALFNKREVLQDDKGKIIDNGMHKRGMFGPFASKFGPMGPINPIGPKFGPITPFSPSEAMPDFINEASFSRKRRSIETPSSADNIISSSSSYPKIIESMSATKPAADAPTEYLPGIFGPFGPGGLFGPFGPGGSFGPSGSFGPVVDPSAIISKKSDFLDTLFKNLATSTPATTTEVPAPKSTIVPPSFWVPSSVIPGPTEYTQKVSDFLDKLFDSINITASKASDDSDMSDLKRSLESEVSPDKNARSLNDASSIATAKDAIVDTILSELGDLKGDMIATLNDLIAYEKAAAATSTKKPFKPFSSIFPFAKPTLDPTLPFQQRMTVLSQVFDMLTDLQRNISLAAKNAAETNTSTPNNPELVPLTNTADTSSINNTLLNAILKKISETPAPASVPVNFVKENPIASRALPKGPTSFWVSYPENSAVKRQINDDLLPYFGYENDNDHRQHTRGVQMQMHQGYQSLPAGSVESVQAGGGSTPGHQGGGIKLLGSNTYGNMNKWADWMQYHKNEYQDRRHHHNHH